MCAHHRLSITPHRPSARARAHGCLHQSWSVVCDRAHGSSGRPPAGWCQDDALHFTRRTCARARADRVALDPAQTSDRFDCTPRRASTATGKSQPLAGSPRKPETTSQTGEISDRATTNNGGRRSPDSTTAATGSGGRAEPQGGGTRVPLESRSREVPLGINNRSIVASAGAIPHGQLTLKAAATIRPGPGAVTVTCEMRRRRI